MARDTDRWTYKKTTIFNGRVEDFSMTLKIQTEALDRMQAYMSSIIKFDRKKMSLHDDSYEHPVLRTEVDILTAYGLS